MKKLIPVVCLLAAQFSWAAGLDSARVDRMVIAVSQAQPEPHVACELKKGDSYQLSAPEECLQDPAAKEEVTLLKRFLLDLSQRSTNVSFNTKWLGPVNLSSQVLEQTFLVNHSWRAITERFMGFGPEDDPQFDYTKPGYYPNGTVKVNLTERAFDVIRLYYGDIIPQYGIDSAEARGLRDFLGMVFFHEIMHGWQLHTLPVLDYKRLELADLQAMFDSRQPDEKVVWGSNQIINYEEDANVFTYHYMASIYENFRAFVTAFETLSKDPKFFQKYPRLADTFYQYYLVNQLEAVNQLRREIANGKTLDTFNELNTYTYRGQNTPLSTWAEMVRINDQLAAGASCEAVEKTVRAKYEYFMNLAVPEWNGRSATDAHQGIIMDTIRSIEKTYSGLKESKEAALKEFKAFEKRCNIKL